MAGKTTFLTKNKSIILCGISLAVLLLLLKWLELRFIIINNALEIYAGSIAIIFTPLGIWLALKLTKPNNGYIIYLYGNFACGYFGFTNSGTLFKKKNEHH
ncbi:hypothetical protein [Pedobacter miscanthi]|uniref:hypothetical protein n=1 Tax=Pedobacter miscanthi TaxID=2259170 RepID=UPI002930426D|nr:hypothetical protein [Pedobacter miscanthi]